MTHILPGTGDCWCCGKFPSDACKQICVSSLWVRWPGNSSTSLQKKNQRITKSVMRKTISFLANFKHHRQLMLSSIYHQLIAHKKSQLKYLKCEIVSGLLCNWAIDINSGVNLIKAAATSAYSKVCYDCLRKAIRRKAPYITLLKEPVNNCPKWTRYFEMTSNAQHLVPRGMFFSHCAVYCLAYLQKREKLQPQTKLLRHFKAIFNFAPCNLRVQKEQIRPLPCCNVALA